MSKEESTRRCPWLSFYLGQTLDWDLKGSSLQGLMVKHGEHVCAETVG